MESSAHPSYMLLFDDGPATEERVHVSVTPTPTRWFCTSGELGSDKRIEWWTMEEPPEDPDIEITKYVATTTDLAEAHVNGEGDTEIHYTSAVPVEQTGPPPPTGSIEDHMAKMAEADPALAERLAAMGTQLAPTMSIPRSGFRAEDICAVMVGGQWIDVPVPGSMFELVIEPSDGPVKIAIGANLIFQNEAGEWIAITPQMVNGFKFRPSSVAQKPEFDGESGAMRVGRDTYDAGDAEVQRMVAEAEKVIVVEPNGAHVTIKSRDGEN